MIIDYILNFNETFNVVLNENTRQYRARYW